MSYGLNVWDGNGKLTLGLSDSITRILGTVQTTKNVNGSVSAPFSNGRPWAQVLKLGATYEGLTPRITISGDTLSWVYDGGESGRQQAYSLPVLIIYGVY